MWVVSNLSGPEGALGSEVFEAGEKAEDGMGHNMQGQQRQEEILRG